MLSAGSLKDTSMEELRKFLMLFPGGSVDLIKRPDGLAVLLLNQEKKKNAMTGKMMVDLYEAVEELDSWAEGKGLIVKGCKNNFCSGGDLDFIKQIGTPEEGYKMSQFMQTTLTKLQKLPMISVALIEGIGALGGGAELCVACDFRLISETCKGIGFVHGKMGLIPAWGGANRLTEKIGCINALEMLSTANIFSPEECYKIGIVNDIISQSENPDEFAIKWLQKRTNFSANLTRNIKTILIHAKDKPQDYETQRKFFAPFWGGKENKEALQKNIKHKPDS